MVTGMAAAITDPDDDVHGDCCDGGRDHWPDSYWDGMTVTMTAAVAAAMAITGFEDDDCRHHWPR